MHAGKLYSGQRSCFWIAVNLQLSVIVLFAIALSQRLTILPYLCGPTMSMASLAKSRRQGHEWDSDDAERQEEARKVELTNCRKHYIYK